MSAGCIGLRRGDEYISMNEDRGWYAEEYATYTRGGPFTTAQIIAMITGQDWEDGIVEEANITSDIEEEISEDTRGTDPLRAKWRGRALP